MANVLLCAEQTASFIHASSDQLILSLGLWTGVREVELEGEVQTEGGDGNVRTCVLMYVTKLPATLTNDFTFYFK